MQSKIRAEKLLAEQITELVASFPEASKDQLFVAWFLHSYVTDSLEEANRALTARTREKGADAIFIDHKAEHVHIVQGKFHRKVGDGSEKRDDVLAFASLPHSMLGTNGDFEAFLKGMNPTVVDKYRDARNMVKKREYQISFYFVTTKNCSSTVARDTGQHAKSGPSRSHVVRFQVIDAARIQLLIHDYIHGVAPAIDSVFLPLEQGGGAITEGPFMRKELGTGIQTWIVPVSAFEIGRVVDNNTPRIFARNIRGFLGEDTPVSKSIAETLTKEPRNFWYYNNGITIVCDAAERVTRSGGIDGFELTNPQLINGQQTARTIVAAGTKAKKASVTVRFIVVPRIVGNQQSSDEFEKFINNIVIATNWQNKIIGADLVANDRRQITLERELRKYSIYYLRKRMTKHEAQRFALPGHRVVKKEDFAHAVAVCDYQAHLVVAEGNALFESPWYSQIFSSDDPMRYLGRYWLMEAVKSAAWGRSEGKYTKWLVLHTVWNDFQAVIRKRDRAVRFFDGVRRKSPEFKQFESALEPLFKVAFDYYKKNREQDGKEISEPSFFKQPAHESKFRNYLDLPTNNSVRSTYESRLQSFSDSLES